MQIFKERGHKVDNLKTMSEEELCRIIGDYDALIVRSATKVTPAIIKAANKMRIIGRAGVGVDNIDISAATQAGVMVMNTPMGNTVSTAQLALSLLTSVARKLPAADMSVKRGEWSKSGFEGVELLGKTLAIVGCGRIGQVVAESATVMGMNVIGFDPTMAPELMREAGIRPVDLPDIWAEADFITFHTPLTDLTKNILNDDTIAMCKDGVRIINCARGGIVDEDALLRGLESGKVSGAALDVYTSEPPKENLAALLAHPNLVCTPHLGASTEEAQINVAKDIAVQISDVFENKDYTGVINVSYMNATTQPAMKSFMRLAETMGQMHATIANDGKPVKMEIRTWGGRAIDITTPSARALLSAQVLKGIIKNSIPEIEPDLISAPGIAASVGLEAHVSDEHPENVGSPYWNLMSVKVEKEGGEVNTITGSVFGNVPHIVQVNDYVDCFAFEPAGKCMLTFENEDRPGAISEVLEVLHQAGVNVASVNIAASKVAIPRECLCFMSLDDDVPSKSLRALQSLPGLKKVSKIQL